MNKHNNVRHNWHSQNMVLQSNIKLIDLYSRVTEITRSYYTIIELELWQTSCLMSHDEEHLKLYRHASP